MKTLLIVLRMLVIIETIALVSYLLWCINY